METWNSNFLQLLPGSMMCLDFTLLITSCHGFNLLVLEKARTVLQEHNPNHCWRRSFKTDQVLTQVLVPWWFFLSLDQRPTHTSASGIYSKSIWDSLVHAGSWAHLGALLVSSLTLLVLAQRLCLVMTVHLHILNCGHTVTLNLWVLICWTLQRMRLLLENLGGL